MVVTFLHENQAPCQRDKMGNLLSYQPRQSNDHQLKVVIVGAGLGGLGAAISIALAGHKVRLIERAPEIKEVARPQIAMLLLG